MCWRTCFSKHFHRMGVRATGWQLLRLDLLGTGMLTAVYLSQVTVSGESEITWKSASRSSHVFSTWPGILSLNFIALMVHVATLIQLINGHTSYRCLFICSLFLCFSRHPDTNYNKIKDTNVSHINYKFHPLPQSLKPVSIKQSETHQHNQNVLR